MTVDFDVIRVVAERRDGLVTPDDLRDVGLSAHQIDRLLARGVLHRVARGVLSAVGPSLTQHQRALAVCAAIPDAVISHASAAEHWGLRRAQRGRLEITVPPGRKVTGCDALVHRSNHVPSDHVVSTIDGLRVTSVARTLFDAGGWLDPIGHRSMIEDARNKALVTDVELAIVFDQLASRGRRGSGARHLLLRELEVPEPPVMSEYELRLADALVAAGLPTPVRQHEVHVGFGTPIHVDLALVAALLALEVDHERWHAGLTAFHGDRARDARLAAVGWLCLRFTDQDIDLRLRPTVALVRAVYERRLAQLGSPGVAA